jgi:DNA-binding LacI/PurR family transcriptional regulator
MHSRITQRDIAREADVSHVTVSLALRGDPAISRKTRKRIERTAKLLGYFPDPMLSALSSYRRHDRPPVYHATIGWLVNCPPNGNHDRADIDLYYKGAKARAAQLGYVLDEIDFTAQSKDFKWLRRLLEARNISGLILGPTPWGPEVSDSSKDGGFDVSRNSVIRIGYSQISPLVNTVANSYFRNAFTAMQKVVALRYQRIGIVLTEEVDEQTSWHLLGGYRAGQHLLPKKDWISPFYVSPRIDLAPAVHEWILKEKIDCIISVGYGSLYHELTKRGLNIPGEVGFVDAHLAEGVSEISGVHQNSRQMGVAAVDLLADLLRRGETGIPKFPYHHLIEGSWREGKTLTRRGKKPALALEAFDEKS